MFEAVALAWAQADPEGHARFRRDAPLFEIASKVRGLRAKAALAALLTDER